MNGLDKPKFREPCNGCGLCCIEQACDVSVEYLKSYAAPCIALEHDGEKFRCGLAVRPQHYLDPQKMWANEALSELFAKVIGSGQGCGYPDYLVQIEVQP